MPQAWAINEDAGSPEYAAQSLRRIAGMWLFPGSGHRMGARQGVRPVAGAVVTVSGTTWTVHDLQAVVYPGITQLSGPYVVQLPEESGALNPADGSNPRLDALDLQVRDDDEDASGERDVRVVYVPGNPASSPAAPALTPNSLRLATILVPAGGSPAPSVQTLGPYAVAAGGVLPLRSGEALPTTGLHDGMVVWDGTRLRVRSGSAWVAPVLGWQPIGSGTVDGVTNFAIDLTAGGAFPAGTFTKIRLRMDGRTSGLTRVTVRMNNDSTSSLHQSSFITWNAEDAAPQAGETESGLTGTTALVGRWSTSLRGNIIDTTFDRTHESSRNPYMSESVRQATGAGNFAQTVKAWGSLDEDRQLSSLQLRTAGLVEDFLATRWIVEGYRA